MAPLSAARKFRNQDAAAAAVAPNAPSFRKLHQKKKTNRNSSNSSVQRNALRGDDVLLQGAIRFIQHQQQQKMCIYIHTRNAHNDK